MVSSAQHAIVPLILNGIMRGIAIAIGLILLIVPGLILMTIWAVTSPAIVVENESSTGAFGRSWELVKGEGWSVFFVILIAFLITFAVGLVAVAIGAAIGLAGIIILAIIAGVVTAPIPALVASIMFFDLGGGATAPPAAGPDRPAGAAGPRPSDEPPPGSLLGPGCRVPVASRPSARPRGPGITSQRTRPITLSSSPAASPDFSP